MAALRRDQSILALEQQQKQQGPQWCIFWIGFANVYASLKSSAATVRPIFLVWSYADISQALKVPASTTCLSSIEVHDAIDFSSTLSFKHKRYHTTSGIFIICIDANLIGVDVVPSIRARLHMWLGLSTIRACMRR